MFKLYYNPEANGYYESYMYGTITDSTFTGLMFIYTEDYTSPSYDKQWEVRYLKELEPYQFNGDDEIQMMQEVSLDFIPHKKIKDYIKSNVWLLHMNDEWTALDG
jgi:hypothetical protein